MRAYSTSVVATALGIAPRWLDTVIALARIDGVRRERQGVSRAFSPGAVVTIAVAIDLIEALHMPITAALDLAKHLIERGGEFTPTHGLSLRIDVAAIERRMAGRLTEAVETHPPPRRGRPPLARR